MIVAFSCKGFFSVSWVFGVVGWVGFMSFNECMLFFMVILH